MRPSLFLWFSAFTIVGFITTSGNIAAAEPDKLSEERKRKLIEAVQRRLAEGESSSAEGFGAARYEGKSDPGAAVRSPEKIRYSAIIQKQIKSNWRWQKETKEKICVVRFAIADDGVISRMVLEKSSGDTAFDESTMAAVRTSTPLPSPPESVREQFRDVRITFNSLE